MFTNIMHFVWLYKQDCQYYTLQHIMSGTEYVKIKVWFLEEVQFVLQLANNTQTHVLKQYTNYAQHCLLGCNAM
jgi:hypothetical protein